MLQPKLSYPKRELAERLHSGIVSLGWTMARIHEETGIDRARLSLFMKHKRATNHTAGRLAIFLAGVMAERS